MMTYCSTDEDTTLFQFKHILFRRKGIGAGDNTTMSSPLLLWHNVPLVKIQCFIGEDTMLFFGEDTMFFSEDTIHLW